MTVRRYDLFYFAGFFDGEGAIMLSRKGAYVRLTVAVSQNTVEVITWHKRCFGGNWYAYTPPNRPDTTIFQWKVNGEDAVAFLKQVAPMLIIKKAHALDAIKAWEYRHTPEISDPLIEKWKEYHAERRRRIAEAKRRQV